MEIREQSTRSGHLILGTHDNKPLWGHQNLSGGFGDKKISCLRLDSTDGITQIRVSDYLSTNPKIRRMQRRRETSFVFKRQNTKISQARTNERVIMFPSE